MENAAPTSVLFRLAARGDWDAVASRCAAHPEDAAYRDAWSGYTPLHVALERGPPDGVVGRLIEAYPTAARIGSLVGKYDDVYLPLHTAAAAGEGPETLRLLGRAYPGAALRRGGHYYPDRTPLENLFGHYFGERIWCSGTVGWEGHGWAHRPPSHKRLYGHLATLACTQSLARLPVSHFWVQASLFLDIASRGRKATEVPILESGDELLVIRAASALRLFTAAGEGFGDAVDCPELLRDMIIRVLRSVLRGVSRRKQSTGRFLLHRAIEDGLPWPAIFELYQTSPEMLSMRDGQTGLFPFMLAAAAASNKQDCSWQLECLNVTFTLLKFNPSLVFFR